MFFKPKEKELLYEENVRVNCKAESKEHLQILSVVADKMLDDETADKIANGDAKTVYRILSGRN